jgi:16S rRNA (cytidine1402-2'-O)-methyltransferase
VPYKVTSLLTSLPESKEKLGPGLYLVPSPLGHLGDISLRQITVLKAADLVAAEDTRRTLKLLNYLGIPKSLVSYREQNHFRIWPRIKKVLESGGLVALLSDAGSPIIADPGAMLVNTVRSQGYAVVPLPGPSAVITALIASGFTASKFFFGGFLPSRSSERRTYISSLKNFGEVLIFFEVPHRLLSSLKDLSEILGSRQALLAREMTKIHEEYLFLPLDKMVNEISLNPRRGEMTLVISPPEVTLALEPDWETLKEEILSDDRPTAEVARDWALRTGCQRKKIYDLLVCWRREDKS